jgi:hypothetical protein
MSTDCRRDPKQWEFIEFVNQTVTASSGVEKGAIGKALESVRGKQIELDSAQRSSRGDSKYRDLMAPGALKKAEVLSDLTETLEKKWQALTGEAPPAVVIPPDASLAKPSRVQAKSAPQPKPGDMLLGKAKGEEYKDEDKKVGKWRAKMSSFPEESDQWVTEYYPPDSEERKKSTTTINPQGLLLDSEGKPVDTTRMIWADTTEIGFVADPKTGTIHTFKERTPKVDSGNQHKIVSRHHTTPLAGGDVAGAGHLKVKEGRIQEIDDLSGHHKPGETFTHQTVNHLDKQGALVDRRLLGPTGEPANTSGQIADDPKTFESLLGRYEGLKKDVSTFGSKSPDESEQKRRNANNRPHEAAREAKVTLVGKPQFDADTFANLKALKDLKDKLARCDAAGEPALQNQINKLAAILRANGAVKARKSKVDNTPKVAEIAEFRPSLDEEEFNKVKGDSGKVNALLKERFKIELPVNSPKNAWDSLDWVNSKIAERMAISVPKSAYLKAEGHERAIREKKEVVAEVSKTVLEKQEANYKALGGDDALARKIAAEHLGINHEVLDQQQRYDLLTGTMTKQDIVALREAQAQLEAQFAAFSEANENFDG